MGATVGDLGSTDIGEAMGGQSVLLISFYPTHPPNGGRMVRLFQLARAIRQIGYRPILLYQDFVGGDHHAMLDFWGPDFHFVPYRAHSPSWRIRRIMRKFIAPGSRTREWGIRLLSALPKWRQRYEQGEFRIGLDDLYDANLTLPLHEIAEREKPCAAVCLDVFTTRSLEGIPGSVLRILDTNDLYAVGRDGEEGRGALWIEMSLEDELRGYRRADLVWAIQSRDQEKIRSAAPDLEVMTVGHMVDLTPPDFESSLRSREILLVATKHKWNLQGLRWFAAEVYPLLRQELPAQNVVVAGDIAGVLGRELPFRFLGRVSDLAPVYKRARLVISPILGGAGLKIKNVEPMGYGKAVVSTRSAATGLEAAEERAFLVGDGAEGFAAAVRKVMRDDALCCRLMEGAFSFAQEWNENVLAALHASLEMTRRTNNAALSSALTPLRSEGS
jgi:hypothetical protein